MANKKKSPHANETPSERFERVAKRVLERDRKYLERREQKEREAAVTAPRPSQ